MDPRALAKADSRLRICRDVGLKMENCEDYEAFSDLWYTFLSAAKNIYTILELGAKSTPSSRQWFEEKRTERKADTLLHYVYEARNDNEHGLEPVLGLDGGAVQIGIMGLGNSRDFTFSMDPTHGVIARSNDGMPVGYRIVPPRPALKSVQDQKKRLVPVPTIHREKLLEDNDPATIAFHTIRYLSELIEEARTRLKL